MGPATPPLPEALAARLHTAAIRLLRSLRTADEHLGLSGPRASALSVMVFAGPVTLSDLARAERVRLPTVSRLVKSMEAQGLARREGAADDARRVYVSATPKGRRIMLEGRQRRIDAIAKLLAGATPAERKALASTLALLERALGPR